MVAQRGRDLLLKIDVDASGGFETVAGLRSKRITLNSETVDVTDSQSAGQWRQLLAGAGVRHCALSGSGLFKDRASDGMIRRQFFEGLISPWQIVLPALGILEGAFQIASLEFGAPHNREVTFEIALQSAGPIAFIDRE